MLPIGKRHGVTEAIDYISDVLAKMNEEEFEDATPGEFDEDNVIVLYSKDRLESFFNSMISI